jgi:poly(3-hydroxybutyrate) depolymerase
MPALSRIMVGFALLVCAGRSLAGDIERGLQVGGTERSYLIHLPSGDAATPRPLLLVFHGGGGMVADFGGRDEGGRVLSVDETVAAWALVDGCSKAGAPQLLPSKSKLDPTHVFRSDWRGCRAGSAISLYRIQDGGHTWPGGPQYLPRFIVGRVTRQIDANEIMLRFFREHPRQNG